MDSFIIMIDCQFLFTPIASEIVHSASSLIDNTISFMKNITGINVLIEILNVTFYYFFSIKKSMSLCSAIVKRRSNAKNSFNDIFQ